MNDYFGTRTRTGLLGNEKPKKVNGLIRCSTPQINQNLTIKEEPPEVDTDSYSLLEEELIQEPIAGPAPKLNNLEKILKQINKGQKALEKARKIDYHLIPKLQNQAINFIKEKVGMNKREYTLEAIFPNQQSLIYQLNQDLVEIINFYSKELEEVYEDIYKLIDKNKYNLQIKKEIEQDAIPAQIQRYKFALSQFKTFRNQESEFHDPLKSLVKEGKKLNEIIFKGRLAEISNKYDKEEIKTLVYQANLFQTTLHKSIEFSYRTARYQKILNETFRTWRSIDRLKDSCENVREGVNSLIEFNKEINLSYNNCIFSINEAIRKKSYELMINQTNYTISGLLRK
ncbi:MAG: hypothetical protein PHT54_04320 [Candidatus Nanoarchaeia archaeon]|nr:hypothetical protein [Candidatus Nanoarchaeia archaeon]